VQLSLKASDASRQNRISPLVSGARGIRPLTARQRTVLALCYIADLPQREVASVLHVSRSTVASTLADAKAAVLNRDSVPIDNCEDMEGSHDAN